MRRRPGKLPRLTTLAGGRRYALAIARHGELADAFNRMTSLFELTREKQRSGPLSSEHRRRPGETVLWHESLDPEVATKH